MSDSTKVYILGAGCSAPHYPVAKEVAEKLTEFAANQLSGLEASKLRCCVEETCALLIQHKVETIDALAKVLGDTNPEAIKKAKIAMSALFFSLETDAIDSAYKAYAAFFDELFRYGESLRPSLEDRLKATPCRVLTYNYDRLFEHTFIKWAKRVEPDAKYIAENLNDYLNMGLGDSIKIEPGRFSLLKLHGGIGQFNRDGERDHQNTSHLYWPGFHEQLPPLADNPYYQRPGYPTNEPTIIFPHEKQSGEEGSRSRFQDYDSKIWGQAREVCKLAKEIHIIGYSIQSIDHFWFKSLIREANDCTRIILRNRFNEKNSLERRLRGIKEELNKEWEIEYLPEWFFGIQDNGDKSPPA